LGCDASEIVGDLAKAYSLDALKAPAELQVCVCVCCVCICVINKLPNKSQTTLGPFSSISRACGCVCPCACACVCAPPVWVQELEKALKAEAREEALGILQGKLQRTAGGGWARSVCVCVCVCRCVGLCVGV
jgi:hypothetical protein